MPVFFCFCFLVGGRGGRVEGVGMNMNTILRKSIDCQTTKIFCSHCVIIKNKNKSKQKAVKTDIHNYMLEELWSLGFDKDSNRSQREKFSVYLEGRYLSKGSLIWLWVLFHVFVAILIKAPLQYIAVVTERIFRWPLAANEVS